MARAGMKPARIRTSMLLDFDLRPSELPALQKVQNVVCYYRRTKLGGSDTTATIVAAVQRLAFNGGEDEHEPFTFRWDLDREGNIVVGNGSDEKPFLVGFSAKRFFAKLHETQRPSFFTWTLPTRPTRLDIPSLSSVLPMSLERSTCWQCLSPPSSRKKTMLRHLLHCAGSTTKFWASRFVLPM
ncbi:hypothetical protein PC129_g8661 [Phytophthora cactorum]|uniref:Uncharacterized protein n=2 Tax=Phytophthora cactorum TaxID=29920 RepID=A0A329SPP7_9STRA|nr:hypothetical protein Pcac1_g25798 [Phytophthora cactorum]KAG2898308.1 hypothetical protein PC114_g14326 [Phytophthora cactorum]KAG2912214.1 hypothetical protein PC115_g12399 [Phytophthora cactorum]KAG3009713.1 hypothetical protein PC119_g13780 [Phytophthora cactorum]KAG3014405.1 hypothetical protein PC120_g12719 [Phytophthora cactorum]